MNLFGNQLGAPGREILSALNDANLFMAQLVASWVPQAVLAEFYFGWLLSWWLRRQPQLSQNAGSFSQS
jgi:hypothetical protein